MGNLNVSLFGNGNSYSNPIKKAGQEKSNFYEKGPLNFYANEGQNTKKMDTFERQNDYRNMFM